MGLLRDLQAEIETRSLASDGWPSGNGRTASVETTCNALMALSEEQETTRQKAIHWLFKDAESGRELAGLRN